MIEPVRDAHVVEGGSLPLSSFRFSAIYDANDPSKRLDLETLFLESTRGIVS